jgi:hypothetical protein
MRKNQSCRDAQAYCIEKLVACPLYVVWYILKHWIADGQICEHWVVNWCWVGKPDICYGWLWCSRRRRHAGNGKRRTGGGAKQAISREGYVSGQIDSYCQLLCRTRKGIRIATVGFTPCCCFPAVTRGTNGICIRGSRANFLPAPCGMVDLTLSLRRVVRQ